VVAVAVTQTQDQLDRAAAVLVMLVKMDFSMLQDHQLSIHQYLVQLAELTLAAVVAVVLGPVELVAMVVLEL
jgi:hypothetical protein